jgi:hypothetical protein
MMGHPSQMECVKTIIKPNNRLIIPINMFIDVLLVDSTIKIRKFLELINIPIDKINM